MLRDASNHQQDQPGEITWFIPKKVALAKRGVQIPAWLVRPLSMLRFTPWKLPHCGLIYHCAKVTSV